MRFHLLGMPHTEWDDSSLACAYTQKSRKWVKMMAARGHEIVVYGGKVPCAHATESVHVWDVPPRDNARLYDVNWERDFIEINKKIIPEIAARISGRDFICITAGTSQREIIDAFPQFMSVEIGVGYEGICTKYRVFESYSWMHHMYGKLGIVDGLFYDACIPNFFDPADFPSVPAKPREHLAWMGRFVSRKGPHVAYQIAQAAGRQLIMAGQGVLENSPGKIVGAELEIEGKDFIHIGPVDKRKRSSFLATAHALVVPTLYLGPFEGVAVEAMMCGTPIITTDFGAFVEYNINHWTGTRFHTLREAVAGVEEATHLDRNWIQEAARKRFSLEAVGKMYEEYFLRLMDLYDPLGWAKLD